ncbi:hypothetical protein HYW21_01905 [Candidatus Woesearchaeota archaeon]|nr:hypothetical protein [Candidatus Woesearchaeota archaeon]
MSGGYTYTCLSVEEVMGVVARQGSQTRTEHCGLGNLIFWEGQKDN